MPGIARRTLEGPATRLPELAMLGRTRQRASDGLGLERHHHPGLWELCWLARGSADWWVDGELHELAAGWCYLTRPDEPHGSVSGRLESCELHWMQFPDAGRLPGLERADAESLAGAMAGAPHAFPAPGLGPLWHGLWEAIDRRDRLAVACARNAMQRVILAALGAARRPPATPSRAIARALARAAEGPATVATLARAAGLARSAFHARFLAETGDSPAAWLRRRRISAAKRLLLAGNATVLAVAQASGYATAQRFATAFREATGLAPLAWRQRVRGFAA